MFRSSHNQRARCKPNNEGASVNKCNSSHRLRQIHRGPSSVSVSSQSTTDASYSSAAVTTAATAAAAADGQFVSSLSACYAGSILLLCDVTQRNHHNVDKVAFECVYHVYCWTVELLPKLDGRNMYIEIERVGRVHYNYTLSPTICTRPLMTHRCLIESSALLSSKMQYTLPHIDSTSVIDRNTPRHPESRIVQRDDIQTKQH